MYLVGLHIYCINVNFKLIYERRIKWGSYTIGDKVRKWLYINEVHENCITLQKHFSQKCSISTTYLGYSEIKYWPRHWTLCSSSVPTFKFSDTASNYAITSSENITSNSLFANHHTTEQCIMTTGLKNHEVNKLTKYFKYYPNIYL